MKTMILRLGVSATIKLPADPARQQQLRAKLQEYQARGTEEARYKSLILGKVFSEKEVSSTDLSTFVEAEVGRIFNRFLFFECWNVIDDYCKTGGTKTVLGSGLGEQ